MLTKASVVVANDITMTAGAGNVTSSTQDLTAAYEATLRVRFTNGATGPTVQGQVQVQIAEADTPGLYMTLATLVSGTVNAAVSEFFVQLPDTANYLRIVSGSNTGQAVTLRVVLEKITGV